MNGPLAVGRRGAVLHVAIDRARKRNALNGETLAALRDTFTAHAQDDTLIAAVLTGCGTKAFAAGGDLRELQTLDTRHAIEPLVRTACAALAAIRDFPVPVVAALNGHALGGGAELAMACDIRIAAPHVRLAFLQGTLALPPAWGGGEDLVATVGAARAIELLASSRELGAQDMLALGLVQRVAREDEPFDVCTDEFLDRWSHQKPQAMRAVKASVVAIRRGVPPAERAAANLRAFVDCWVHRDHLDAAERKIAALGREARETR